MEKEKINNDENMENEQQSGIKAFFKEIIWYVVVFVVTFLVCRYIILVSTVMSGSMEPTIMTGNTAFCNRLAYFLDTPQRGDKIVFLFEETGEYFFKRVIGVEGDEISFADGYTYINGERLTEDYVAPGAVTECEKTFTVPVDCVFVMGDNRENSYDSRFWENPFVENDNILGRYFGQINFSFEFNIKRPLKALLSK